MHHKFGVKEFKILKQMTTIESQKVDVKASQEEIFDFLMDLQNLEKLLPEGKVSDFKAEENHCSFKVMGAYKIGLQHKSNSKPNNIVLQSDTDSPFPFDLDIKIDQISEGSSAYMVSNADINFFLKQMVEKPLKALFDHIAGELKNHFE